MQVASFLTQTYEQMIRERMPNLFRLYLNPHVVKTCFCLQHYVQETWGTTEPFQTFLANSFDETLSGAIKLARYVASKLGKPTIGLILDPDGRLEAFARVNLPNGEIEFLPGLFVADSEDKVPQNASFGFAVLLPGARARCPATAEMIGRLQLMVIECVDRQSMDDLRARQERALQQTRTPDIVIFDESFVRRGVPFAAFTAKRSMYDHWNTAAKSTFHSTTFQPNTITSLHFLRCLEQDDPTFHAMVADELRLIDTNLGLRHDLFRDLYSPSLAKAIRATDFDTSDVQASGAYVIDRGRRVFDAVGGVACSVRGHNPPSYPHEIAALADTAVEAELARRLRDHTGLECLAPAVSGASAVECALKIALVAQFPRRHVLALKSGFGGKTLFALTGTWNASYKERLDPLYEHVSYIDPFAGDALAQIDAVLAEHNVAVVQLELIQGVGGVRRVPVDVVRHLAANRQEHGYLLLIDEVQTGMFRTGPFALSCAMDLKPDLLVVGKAISDMMFPFALVSYSGAIQAKLDEVGVDLPSLFRQRHGYALGYKTALNVLRFAEASRLADRVTASGTLFEHCLKEELTSCPAVREVRVYGLLIGIELDDSRWPQRWFKKRLFWFYLSAMLKHPRFPVLVGFCQYEPNVLKITPPLTVDADEVRKICATIGDVLRRPFYQLLASAFGGLLRSFAPWRFKHDQAEQSAHEPVLR